MSLPLLLPLLLLLLLPPPLLLLLLLAGPHPQLPAPARPRLLLHAPLIRPFAAAAPAACPCSELNRQFVDASALESEAAQQMAVLEVRVPRLGCGQYRRTVPEGRWPGCIAGGRWHVGGGR